MNHSHCSRAKSPRRNLNSPLRHRHAGLLRSAAGRSRQWQCGCDGSGSPSWAYPTRSLAAGPLQCRVRVPRARVGTDLSPAESSALPIRPPSVLGDDRAARRRGEDETTVRRYRRRLHIVRQPRGAGSLIAAEVSSARGSGRCSRTASGGIHGMPSKRRTRASIAGMPFFRGVDTLRSLPADPEVPGERRRP